MAFTKTALAVGAVCIAVCSTQREAVKTWARGRDEDEDAKMAVFTLFETNCERGVKRQT